MTPEGTIGARRGRPTRSGSNHVNRGGTGSAMVQCVTAMASNPLFAVSAERRSLPVPAQTLPVADLHVATVDSMGRLWVRLSARLLGWMPEQTVMLTIRDGVLHMTGDTSAAAGVPAALDHRRRVQVSFGLRAMVGFRPGTRVLVVTVPSAGSVAVLPVDRVVAAFGIGR